jgi:hypothetical protein
MKIIQEMNYMGLSVTVACSIMRAEWDLFKLRTNTALIGRKYFSGWQHTFLSLEQDISHSHTFLSTKESQQAIRKCIITLLSLGYGRNLFGHAVA